MKNKWWIASILILVEIALCIGIVYSIWIDTALKKTSQSESVCSTSIAPLLKRSRNWNLLSKIEKIWLWNPEPGRWISTLEAGIRSLSLRKKNAWDLTQARADTARS